MEPDVSERRDPEQGVAQRLYPHVAVPMTYETLRVINLHASEHEPEPLLEDVYVVTVSDSEIHFERF